MSETDRCLNCNEPVKVINYAMGPRWMHYVPGAAFEDGVYASCRLTVATPPSPAAVEVAPDDPNQPEESHG